MKLEQRKSNRLLFSIPIQYKVFQMENLEKDVQEKALKFKADIEDMSQGGIQVVSEVAFKNGDILELELKVPGNGLVRTVAKVVWTKEDAEKEKEGHRSGIQFIPVYEEDLQKLKSYFSMLENS